MVNVRAHRFAVLVAHCTFALVVAGGLVTSNDAALSVPDWPLSYGRLVPPLEGGIRFEFAHRAIAAAVAALVALLAVWLQRSEPRAWLRRLGWIAFGAIVAQALLGGARVTLVSWKALPVAHACLAELVFGAIVAIMIGLAVQDSALPWTGSRPAPLVAVVALFAQTILGASVRHGLVSPVSHIIGAGVATILVMWAGLGVLMRQMENATVRRAAMLLLSFTFSQVFLGIGSLMGRLANLEAPQPQLMMIWFTVAHVAMGSAAFGAAVALSMLPEPEGAGLSPKGMVAA